MSMLVIQPVLLFCMAFILCVTTGVILLSFARPDRYGRRLLAASYLFMAGSFGTGLLLTMQTAPPTLFWQRFPHLIWLLYIPVPYFYVRFIQTGKKLSRADMVHGLLPIAFIADYFPGSTGGIEATAPAADGWNRVFEFIPDEAGWLFPAGFHILVTTVVMVLYWVLQIHRLILYSEHQPRPTPKWTRWLTLYTILQLPMSLPSLIMIVTGQANDWVLVIPPATAAILSCFTLLLSPEILYGQRLAQPVSHAPPARQKILFDEESIETVMIRLSTLMAEKKPYLDGNYSPQQLAEEMGMPPHKLSAFINQVTGSHFNDYLNSQRIAHCLTLIERNETSHLNINGLAAVCGFNNRNTFSIAFKKVTGKSPSEYLRSRDTSG